MGTTLSNTLMAQLQQQHVITALVENHPGVLARVAGLFARRGYNIESLTVSVTENPRCRRKELHHRSNRQSGKDRQDSHAPKQLRDQRNGENRRYCNGPRREDGVGYCAKCQSFPSRTSAVIPE